MNTSEIVCIYYLISEAPSHRLGAPSLPVVDILRPLNLIPATEIESRLIRELKVRVSRGQNILIVARLYVKSIRPLGPRTQNLQAIEIASTRCIKLSSTSELIRSEWFRRRDIRLLRSTARDLWGQLGACGEPSRGLLISLMAKIDDSA